jgi:DNA-binding transcriptional ArsR family regulator
LTELFRADILRRVPNQTPRLDRVFQALADPTRRAVVERLSRESAPVSRLAEPFDMALPSFLQHLGVLEECGLVRSRKVGRIRTFRIAPEPLRAAEDWMRGQRALWERRLDQLDQFLVGLAAPTKPRRKKGPR